MAGGAPGKVGGGVDFCTTWPTECVTQTAHSVKLSFATSCVIKCLTGATTPSATTEEAAANESNFPPDRDKTNVQCLLRAERRRNEGRVRMRG